MYLVIFLERCMLVIILQNEKVCSIVQAKPDIEHLYSYELATEV